MSGGILGVAGDLMSVALLCFLLSLALQLYCAVKRQTRLLTPLPSATPTPPPQQDTSTCSQLYLLRIQRSASCPVLSAVAQRPLSPPTLGHVSELPCAGLAASQASAAADLAKLMQQLDSKDDDVDAAPRLLFTIKEEGKLDGVEEEHEVNVAATCDDRASPSWQRSSTCGPLVSQGSSSSLSSEGGGVSSMWSVASSPAVSYLSASSSPLFISSCTSSSTSPPRSSFWAPTTFTTQSTFMPPTSIA